ncbi:MAG: SH3 domain-containing protein [Rhodospirillaceae bacterium]|nr:SH3 domain-containing protein [Rhodospirillaceae bacterium]
MLAHFRVMILAAMMPATMAALVLACSTAPLRAQQVLGVDVEPHAGTYLVLKDANVRARPETRSKRVGRLKAGEQVEAMGRVKGPWIAVRVGDKPLGFVYGPIMMPLVDGTLSGPLKGTTANGTCQYTLEFLGKTGGDKQRFEFADYGVEWSCTREEAKLAFHTPLFLTEGPHQGTQKPVHQITVDLLDLEGGLEEVFSVHFLWDRDKNQVRYDSATIKKFAHAASPKPAEAKNLAAALKAALHLVPMVWTPSVWNALAKKN